MRHRIPALLAAAALVALAACSGGGSGSSGSSASGDTDAKCPLAALRDATGTVNITFWHGMQANNTKVLEAITNDFNASQSKIKVKLVDYSSEPSMLPKYQAGLVSGDLPNIVMMDETTVQSMMDSRSTLPTQACIKADGYDTSDFLPRALAFYTVQGVQRSMPYNVSNPVLLYNKAAFRKAGLDPENPPKTFEEVRAASQQIVDRGAAKHGIALRVAPFINEFWSAKAGQPYANNGNGRKARATKAEIDTPTGREVWTWWRDMVKSGLALNTGAKDGDISNLLSIGTGDAAMTIDGSGVLGPIMAVLGSGQYPGVEPGVGPLPSTRPEGGIQTAEGSLWIVRRGATPAQQAASWTYIKYLESTEQMVRLHLGTGYVPLRRSAAESPDVQARWAAEPEYRVAYDQLANGPLDAGSVGAVIGDFLGVRNAVKDGIVSMLTTGVSPQEALARTQRLADERIAAYNQRVGG